METIDHTFRPSETIHAIIKYYNRANMTLEEVLEVVELFNEINGEEVPRPGQTFKIPVVDDE